jgi:hypothetical protein
VNLSEKHVKAKKKIGYLKGKPVFALETTGGLHLVLCAKGGDAVETLGAGPHRAIARHLARKRHPGLEITELAKSDWVDPACFQHLLPQWEEETDRINQFGNK